jgi:adenylosuccinate lyase
MRRFGVGGAYEQLKELTRGKAGITRETLHALIEKLDIPQDARKRLLALTPGRYYREGCRTGKKDLARRTRATIARTRS